MISRRVERTRIAIDDAHARIVDRLVDARLLTTDEESVQLSHEALAREWPRLKEWLADDVEGQRIMRHLGSAAAAWDAMGRPDSELYRGGRLTTAQHWRNAAGPALTALEREFLDASAAHETAGLAASSATSVAWCALSWVSAGAAALAIVAVAAGVFAGFQANLAGERATVAEARRVAALALEEPDFDRALLLAVEAIQLWDELRDPRQPRACLLARTPCDEHHPHPGGRSGDREHVARDGRDSSIGDRQRPRCAPVRSRRPLAARRVLAVLQDSGDVGNRPRHRRGRVQRDIRPLRVRCDFRRTATLDLGRRRPLGRDDLRGPG